HVRQYCCRYLFIFFFQAEDGIRDFHVTGVQTCALPISDVMSPGAIANTYSGDSARPVICKSRNVPFSTAGSGSPGSRPLASAKRSEERRVGKECRSRWAPRHEK